MAHFYIQVSISNHLTFHEKTYGSSIVGLAEVAIDTTGGGGVDNTAVLLLEEVGPGSLGDLVGTAGMDVHDWVPEVVVHVGESLVAKDTGVVDYDIDTAKGVNGNLDNSITVLGGVLGTDSLSTHGLDLIDNIVGVNEIVNNNGSASTGKGQAVSTADTSTATRDESNTASEVDLLTLLVGAELLRLLQKGEEVVGSARVLWVGKVGDLVPLLENGTRGVGVVALEEQAAGPLPSELGDVTTTDLEDGTALASVVLVNQNGNEGYNPLRLHERENIWGHDGLGHAAGSNGSNDVGNNVVLGTLLGESLREANHGELGGGVVGLAEVAEQTSSRSGVDDATELLLAEVRPGGTSALVAALDVDLHDEVPVHILHVLEADITEDTGVVDENIDAAESLDSSLDDLVTILDAVVVGNGLATGGLDLVDDNIGSLHDKTLSAIANIRLKAGTKELTLESLPSPLKEPPRSLTTTLAPRDAKKVA